MAVLLNNNFEHEVLDIKKDNNGNFLQLLLQCGTTTINLVNIYAPNTDDPTFFEKVKEFSNNISAEYNLICGDFNLVMEPKIDCMNYSRINNPKARDKALQIIEDMNLVDAFRLLNPTIKRYTWRKKPR